jgi:hypothetical protein
MVKRRKRFDKPLSGKTYPVKDAPKAKPVEKYDRAIKTIIKNNDNKAAASAQKGRVDSTLSKSAKGPNALRKTVATGVRGGVTHTRTTASNPDAVRKENAAKATATKSKMSKKLKAQGMAKSPAYPISGKGKTINRAVSAPAKKAVTLKAAAKVAGKVAARAIPGAGMALMASDVYGAVKSENNKPGNKARTKAMGAAQKKRKANSRRIAKS